MEWAFERGRNCLPPKQFQRASWLQRPYGCHPTSLVYIWENRPKERQWFTHGPQRMGSREGATRPTSINEQQVGSSSPQPTASWLKT